MQPQKPPSGKDPQNNSPFSNFNFPRWVPLIILGLLLLWMLPRLQGLGDTMSGNTPVAIDYTYLKQQIEAGNVEQVQFQDAQIRGNFVAPVTYPPANSPLLDQANPVQQRTSDRFTAVLPPISDPELSQLLTANNVTVTTQLVQPSPILELLFTFGPLLIFLGFFIWMARRTQGQMGNVFGFGRTNAREYTVERPQVTFADVAGQDSAKTELVEIVDFLKEPDKYIRLGARIPRGVLLVGPPGTGKTLMARAVAGEANVAFFSIAASEFVEMFVGVGASRVRDLFKRAKDAAPAIVFIDEIDAVGRQRGAGLGGGNDEREQTLNQLLSEMDGFDQTESIIVMAATNRPDVLDPALLRPGRFDRQVTVALPDRTGRLDMLKIHTRGKPLAEDISLEDVAKATIGFSGADISNLANESALTAARRGAKKISQRDFLDAFDRIVLGTKSPPLSNQQERTVVAYHEAGHALVGVLTPNANPVLKVTIVPRGQALGVTASLPDDDRRNYSKEYLMAQIYMLLGGRAAEQVTFNEITTGASNDLRRVTDIARRMVAEFGMSERVGPLNFGDNDRQPFLGYSMATGPRSYSEETASIIDEEVKRIVEESYHEVLKLVGNHRPQLEGLANELLNNEVVDGSRVREIILGRDAAPSHDLTPEPVTGD
ncbi:MAG TPA: ATP-dependent zinc metalloprotease FtsH [Aggregatilineales bacterium]|nr:ATP-dependent zinc metalloprotease FtsH [Aggregatilineales bacterium]